MRTTLICLLFCAGLPGAVITSGCSKEDATSSASSASAPLPSWWQASQKKVVRVFGSLELRRTDQVASVVFSPDGRYVLAAGDKLVLSDAQSGCEVRTFGDPAQSFVYARLGEDGARVMAIQQGSPPTFIAWTTETGVECQRTVLAGLEQLADARITPNGKACVCGYITKEGGGRCALVDLNTGSIATQVSLPANGTEVRVDLSADGNRFAAVGYGGGVWRRTSQDPSLMIKGARAPIALSADGSLLAMDTVPTRVWDIDRNQEVHSLDGHETNAYAAAFSADGSRVVTGGGAFNTVRVWDTKTGEEVAVLKGHKGEVTCVALSGDGRRAASAAKDHTIRIWDVESAKEQPIFRGHGEPVRSVGYDAEERKILSTGTKDVLYRWDADSGRLLQKLRTPRFLVKGPVVSPNAALVATVHDDPAGDMGWSYLVRVTNVVSGKLVASFSGMHPLAFSASAKHLAVWQHGSLDVWRVFPQEKLASMSGFHDVSDGCLALSPDASHLAWGSPWGGLEIVRIPDGERLHRLYPNNYGVSALAFTEDGRHLVSSSTKGEVRWWEVETGKCVHTEKLPTAPRCFCFMPDGKQVLAGNSDTSIVLWELGFPQ